MCSLILLFICMGTIAAFLMIVLHCELPQSNCSVLNVDNTDNMYTDIMYTDNMSHCGVTNSISRILFDG